MGAQPSSLGEEELDELCSTTGFTIPQISRLYKRFQHLDKEKLGRIPIDELHAIPELAVNPLAHRIVSVMTADDGVEMSFKQFLTMLDVFSKDAKREKKLDFAFQVYDVDGDGYISASDLTYIVGLMVGNTVSSQEIDQIVDQTIIDADTIDHDGAISFAEFKRAMFSANIENVLSINF